jgi:MYXO-CTERM domain-containing protein
MQLRVRPLRRLGPACAACVLCWPFSALAEPCGVPDVDATYPPNRAPNVPANAVLAAHYGAPPDYAGEAVTLTHSDGTTFELSTTFVEAEGLLRAAPLLPLVPGDYTASFPRLRGSSTGTGRGREISFFVGGAFDAAPPVFEGLRSVTWDLSREKDPCTDTLEDRYVFDFELGLATDDSDPSLLAVLVFETERPSSGPATLPKAVGIYPFPIDGKLRVHRPPRKAGKSCFAAVTRDMAGFVSAGGNAEVCEETIEPPWFEGCSVAPAPRGNGAAWLALLLLVALRRRARASDERVTPRR